MRTARTVVLPLPSRVMTVIGSSSAAPSDRERRRSAIAHTPVSRMDSEYQVFVA
jgi:hypothetical protein